MARYALHHLGDVLVEQRTVRARRAAAVGALDRADAGLGRIDVVELVNDRIELRQPRLADGVQVGLARARQRLVAEPRQHERDQVLDRPAADADERRLRDEPRRAARQLSGVAILPEVVAGLALRQRQAMAGGESSLGVRSAEAPEDDHFAEIDERQPRRTRDDVLHQERNALGVVDHANTRRQRHRRSAGSVLVASVGAVMLKRAPTIKSCGAILSR